MNIYKYSLIISLLVLSACKVSKDIQAPKDQLPVTYASKADSSNIADLKWQNFFTDATLQKLIDAAILRNFDMQIAIKNIEASQLLFKQVNWNYAPELNLNISGNSNRPSDNSLTGISLSKFGLGKSIANYSADIGLAWEADIWGKIRSQKRAALAAYLQTTEAKKAIQTNLIAGVSQGYYNLLMLDEQLAIAQKNMALNDTTIRFLNLQYSSGQVTSLAVEQAQAQRLTAALLIPRFEQAIAVQENALKVLTGELPGKIERSKKLTEIVFSDSFSTGVPSQLLSNRPDVKSHELALNIANANVGISKASMYPSIRITADAGLNSFKSNNWFNIPASLFGIVGGAVVQPILMHKILRTRYKVALVERDRSVLQFRQSVLVAFEEVSNALVTLDKLKAEQQIARERAETLERAVANANMLFKNGLANYLEVITAQGNALQSELELASINKVKLDAAAQLYKSLGGGWK